MKRCLTIAVLLTIFVVGNSFKLRQGIADQMKYEQLKSRGFLMAAIDGKMFETREENKYTAELANKSIENISFSAPAGSKITTVANVMNFYGTDFRDGDNNVFTERLSFEYAFNEGALGEVDFSKIILNYNHQKYYNITSESNLKVTKIQWSADRRNFVMSADFDCKLRRWGSPISAQPVVRLKGKMENVAVAVPSWIVIKNPGQTAER